MNVFQGFYPVFIGVFVLSLATFVNGDDSDSRLPPSNGPRPHLTEEQRDCLDSKLGVPGQGERPTHEEMEAAFSACGIAKPEGPAPDESPH
jgi:hypothetical protein